MKENKQLNIQQKQNYPDSVALGHPPRRRRHFCGRDMWNLNSLTEGYNSVGFLSQQTCKSVTDAR